MTIKINSQAQATDGTPLEKVIIALTQQSALTLASSVTSLTDSSGGTDGTVTAVNSTFTDTAASGSNLASKATTESALGTVKDALLELATKANAYATLVGVSGLTYNGGGTAVDGTVDAVTVSTTGATTGPTAANLGPLIDAINTATYKITVVVNRIATALGLATITNLTGQTFSSTVAALSTGTGTAASPGCTKAAVDAALVTAANNIATLATKINTFNNGVTAAKVAVV